MNTKTLKELNVKPGDVVEYIPKGRTSTVTKVVGDVYYGCSDDDDTPVGPYTDKPHFRVVSRASAGTPKLWRDMTPEEKGALLLAHHEGKQIELLNCKTGGWMRALIPAWIPCAAYRVKPVQPSVQTVVMYTQAPSSCWGWTADSCSTDRTHRITFDTVDGEPNVNSIKMEKL
jgi:hypothetical protein